MKGYLLERMTWPKIRKAFEQTTFVVIPIGSTEQHGPHLPLGTDFLVAHELASRVMAHAEVIVTPTLPFGYAKYHTVFPGTLSLSETTLARALIDICEDLLKYGTTHILFINGHGGNKGALRRCGEWLREKCIPMAVACWWEMTGVVNPEWQQVGHADYIETAAILALDPTLADMAKARLYHNKDLTPRIKLDNMNVARFGNTTLTVNNVMSDVTSAGNMLEHGISKATDYNVAPDIATPEMGEAILSGLTDYLVEFIAEFKNVKYAPVGLAADLEES
ncbi:MAG: creatininase family protein [Anaerolineaceae bacterium]|nr:creatininase family protein [Anaerolineaceae bacterium]